MAPFEAVFDDLGPRTYLEIQAMNGELPFGMRHYWKATFLRELDADGLDAVMTAHASRVGGASGVLIEPIRGAARRFPADHAALGTRDAAFHVSALAIYEDAAEDDRQIGWARETAAALRPWALDRSYINYLSPDETGVRREGGVRPVVRPAPRGQAGDRPRQCLPGERQHLAGVTAPARRRDHADAIGPREH